MPSHKLWRRFLLLLLLLCSSISLADSIKWVSTEHTVRKRQSLRTVAKIHFGVRQAVHCLKAQLNLKDPDRIYPGQKLYFLSPSQKYRLKNYLQDDLSCNPDQVVHRGQTYKRDFEQRKNRGLASPEETNTTLALKNLDIEYQKFKKMVTFASAGAGVTYSDIKQKSNDNSVGYKTIEPGSLAVRARLAVAMNWALLFQFESLPSLFPGEQVGANDVLLNFKKTSFDFQRFLPDKNFQWLQYEFQPYFELGLQHYEIPIIDPIKGEPISPKQTSTQVAKLGGGLLTNLAPHWRLETRLFAGYPIFAQNVSIKASDGFLGGGLYLTKDLSENWQISGLWQGSLFSTKYGYDRQSSAIENNVQIFFSSLELVLGRQF